MDGFYYRRFDREDVRSIVERIRTVLGLPDHGIALRLLGQAGFDTAMHCVNGRISSRFLDGIFDLCAEHGLSRMYILLGSGPVRVPNDKDLSVAEAS